VGSIGVAELFIIGLIALLLLAAPVVVFVWLLRQRRAPPRPRAPQLVPCSACGTGLALGVMACPQCGEPRPA
jgi:hypothetical protein